MCSKVLMLGSAILLVGMMWSSYGTAPAQEMEVIAGGEIEYQRYCGVCHGVDGRGRGLMSRFLTIPPSDLTALSKKNAGRYPFWQVFRAIDGREGVRGHGTGELPVWGARFRADAGADDGSSRAQVAGRILALVFYLQHIHE